MYGKTLPGTEAPGWETTCLVMGPDGVIQHGPCDGPGAAPLPGASPVVINPGARVVITPTVAAAVPEVNWLPLIVIGVIGYLLLKG